MTITRDEFAAYTGIVTTDYTLIDIFIESAENIVEDHLNKELTEFTSLPGIIKLTVLRIASLLQFESDGNIGVTSKSFDNYTRTFYKTTDFTKYLEAIPVRYRNIA